MLQYCPVWQFYICGHFYFDWTMPIYLLYVSHIYYIPVVFFALLLLLYSFEEWLLFLIFTSSYWIRTWEWKYREIIPAMEFWGRGSFTSTFKSVIIIQREIVLHNWAYEKSSCLMKCWCRSMILFLFIVCKNHDEF